MMKSSYYQILLAVLYIPFYLISVYWSTYTSVLAYIDAGKLFEISIDFACWLVVTLYAPLALYVSFLIIKSPRSLLNLTFVAIITVFLIALVSWISYYLQSGIVILICEYVVLGILFHFALKRRLPK